MAGKQQAVFHLPGLFEFYDFYQVFFRVFSEHRDFFYPWARVGSVYGAPADSLWAGGRLEEGGAAAEEVLSLLGKYGISARLTFSNSLLEPKHLADEKCSRLCRLFEEKGAGVNGVIVHSELLTQYLREKYPGLYLVSSTTKVLTDFEAFRQELRRKEFAFVVPDFRLNKQLEKLNTLSQKEKEKTEFLVNECCWTGCADRRACYESVSRRALDPSAPEHVCAAPGGSEGYRFSRAMKSPAFISRDDILNTYLPAGFSQFKIEGRSLGSAVLLEFLLYYLTKPEHHLEIRELIYLDSSLDLF